MKISRTARKQLQGLPKFIVIKLLAWIEDVEASGVEEVRKVPGFHDEPLKGKRRGQRSIRLSRAYRAIYQIKSDGSVEFIEIKEVTKHEY